MPIIIALALVAKAPALYGVQVQPEKPAEVDIVKLEHPIDLHLVSDATGANLEDLRLLNPELLRTTTPSLPQFELKLPAGLSARFRESVVQVPEEKWTNWRLHTVADNETLSDIAKHYRVTVPAIETANHLEAHSIVPTGFLLNIPDRAGGRQDGSLPGAARRFSRRDRGPVRRERAAIEALESHSPDLTCRAVRSCGFMRAGEQAEEQDPEAKPEAKVKGRSAGRVRVHSR